MAHHVVSGGGGFIPGHIIRTLLDDGDTVIAVDIKPLSEWWQVHDGALNLPDRDLMHPDNCVEAVLGADWVWHFACPMGGVGWITRQLHDCARSSKMTSNMLDASIAAGVQRFWLSSSACMYDITRQGVTEVEPLAEWMGEGPLGGEPGYGLSKAWEERLCAYATQDCGIETRIGRYHNIMGSPGTWEGGKEKAPAAMCRKVAEAVVTGRHVIDIWGDGEQTRTYCWVDDCVRATRQLMASDFVSPLNIGSAEMVSVNQLVSIVEEVAGIECERRYDLTAPQGVRGRSSDNTLCESVLGWAPSTPLRDGIAKLYPWVEARVMERHGG